MVTVIAKENSDTIPKDQILLEKTKGTKKKELLRFEITDGSKKSQKVLSGKVFPGEKKISESKCDEDVSTKAKELENVTNNTVTISPRFLTLD